MGFGLFKLAPCRAPPKLDVHLFMFFLLKEKNGSIMDSTAIQAITDNTAAVMALTGSLWTIAGFLGFVFIGIMAIRYTLKG